MIVICNSIELVVFVIFSKRRSNFVGSIAAGSVPILLIIFFSSAEFSTTIPFIVTSLITIKFLRLRHKFTCRWPAGVRANLQIFLRASPPLSIHIITFFPRLLNLFIYYITHGIVYSPYTYVIYILRYHSQLCCCCCCYSLFSTITLISNSLTYFSLKVSFFPTTYIAVHAFNCSRSRTILHRIVLQMRAKDEKEEEILCVAFTYASP